MKEPIWLISNHVLAFHTKQIHLHGGLAGIRDQGLLESAISRPQQLWAYSKQRQIFKLAAAYAYSIIQNHPFIDGNKRTGIISAGVFLKINGRVLEVSEMELVKKTLALAEKTIQENDFATWLQQNSFK